MLGGWRLVLLVGRWRIWFGGRVGMRHIILRPQGGSRFIWDRGDCVGMRLGGWGHIGWLVRHWSHCELLTCVVDVFVALFMVGHLKTNEIEGT